MHCLDYDLLDLFLVPWTFAISVILALTLQEGSVFLRHNNHSSDTVFATSPIPCFCPLFHLVIESETGSLCG